jgi:tripartite-type tricarboxylate transporter receptor subunit TctC
VTNTPYRGPEDYQPIIKMVELDNVLAVRANAPWKTLEEFLGDARKRPGAIRVSNAGARSIQDVTVVDLKRVAKVDLTNVPFSGGGGEAITALLGGHVEATVSYPGTVKPMADSGQLRVLAGLSSKVRNPLFPDVPSAQELGYQLTAPATMYFVMGPKGLSSSVVDTLYKAFAEAMKTAAFVKFAKDNGEVVDPLGPAELTQEIRRQMQAFAKIAEELKLRDEKK